MHNLLCRTTHLYAVREFLTGRLIEFISNYLCIISPTGYTVDYAVVEGCVYYVDGGGDRQRKRAVMG